MLKREEGFTLIEMLIVLLVITILILLILPNLSDKTKVIHGHGCDALVSLVQAQVAAYELDHDKLPISIDALVTEKYISTDQKTCKNGNPLTLTNGTVGYAQN